MYDLEWAECDHFIGTVTDVPASGYSVYLPLNNYTEASRIIRLLKANTAIMNLNTRAVAVEFVVYNPIVEMFSLVSLVTEMSVSGVVVPNAQFHTYQILPYTSYLWLQFLGECVIYAFFIKSYLFMVPRTCKFKLVSIFEDIYDNQK